MLAEFPLPPSVAFEPDVLPPARFDPLDKSQTPQKSVLALDAIPADVVKPALGARSSVELVTAEPYTTTRRDER